MQACATQPAAKPAPTAPPALLEQMRLAAAGHDCVTTLEGVHELPALMFFDHNSDVLTADDQQALDGVMTMARFRAPDGGAIKRLAIVGHADKTEDDPTALATSRAEHVMAALKARGFGAQLETHSLGTTPHAHYPKYDDNRVVDFETLFEYRGPEKRWDDDHFVACTHDDPHPDCAPPPGFRSICGK
jgi:outer membrane protein OmpA-like peptidoglycan-associated protein